MIRKNIVGKNFISFKLTIFVEEIIILNIMLNFLPHFKKINCGFFKQ